MKSFLYIDAFPPETNGWYIQRAHPFSYLHAFGRRFLSIAFIYIHLHSISAFPGNRTHDLGIARSTGKFDFLTIMSKKCEKIMQGWINALSFRLNEAINDLVCFSGVMVAVV